MKIRYPVSGSFKAIVPILLLAACPISIKNQKPKKVNGYDSYVHRPPEIEAADTFDYRKAIKIYGIKTEQEIIFEKKQQLISDIIKNDKSSPKEYTDVDRKKLAKGILKASEMSGVDFDIITFIAQHESHFNQNLSGENGKGLMQITSIVPKDMFQRPSFYDENLEPMIKEYGSLEKLFEAKDNDAFLELGNFGEFLYKHKTPKNLIKACINDAQTNLITGAYCYKAKHKLMGNMFDALAEYNSTEIKYDYAKSIQNRIINWRKK